MVYVRLLYVQHNIYGKWIYYGYRQWFLTKLPGYLTKVNRFYHSSDINTKVNFVTTMVNYSLP